MSDEPIVEFRGEHAFLSNFWPSPIVAHGFEWPTAEHLFQASKTEDPTWRTDIFMARTPSVAKRLGRKAPLIDHWELLKTDFMWRIVRGKFDQNPDLRHLLLRTGDRWLVEGNRWGDTFWGVDLRSGRGRNELGRVLMLVRAEMRDLHGWHD